MTQDIAPDNLAAELAACPQGTQDMTELAEQIERLEGLPDRIKRRLAVDGRGCWNWIGPKSLNGRGRGMVSVDGKLMLHHRAVWTLLRGPIPEGAFLCHHCDNARCANPGHIYIGDHKSNVRDMWARGRHWTQREPERARQVGLANGLKNNWAKGARNPKAKLTPEQVAEIARSPCGPTALARHYGVHRTTIQRIRKGALWAS